MEVIREIADLERERDKQVNKTRRMSCPTITRNTLSGLEEKYIRLKDLHSRFPSKVNNWIDFLDTDEEGDPIYPARGMPESRYNPDNEDIARKNSLSEDVLNSTRDILAHFILSLSAQEQSLLVQEIMLPCLKDLDAVKAYVAAQAVGNAGDQDDEDDTNTIINGEHNGVGDEIPQEDENNGLNQGDVTPVPMPPCSQRNSRGSSKSLKI